MIIGLEKEGCNRVRASGLRKMSRSDFFLDKQAGKAENSITLGKEVIQLEINLWISEVAET
jgi:D-alanine-D-alanine ligase-like ATP-grasp enzyme